MVHRFRYARASNLYDNSVGLTHFQETILGKRLDRQLEKNFKLLATPNNIRQWRLAHESDILPDEVQESQSYLHYLALMRGKFETNRDRALIPNSGDDGGGDVGGGSSGVRPILPVLQTLPLPGDPPYKGSSAAGNDRVDGADGDDNDMKVDDDDDEDDDDDDDDEKESKIYI